MTTAPTTRAFDRDAFDRGAFDTEMWDDETPAPAAGQVEVWIPEPAKSS
jgi:hypothetical protein